VGAPVANLPLPQALHFSFSIFRSCSSVIFLEGPEPGFSFDAPAVSFLKQNVRKLPRLKIFPSLLKLLHEAQDFWDEYQEQFGQLKWRCSHTRIPDSNNENNHAFFSGSTGTS